MYGVMRVFQISSPSVVFNITIFSLINVNSKVSMYVAPN